ncbi:hypothetical protein cypCar_00031518 [Cyprinus carpio]|nr:hypothetical protein cypCar_00031518 [Cyprinus carpio]
MSLSLLIDLACLHQRKKALVEVRKTAIKMTALGRPQFLAPAAPVLRGAGEMEMLFQFPGCQAGERWCGGAGAETGSRAIAARLGAQGNIHSCFSDGRLHSSGTVDMLDWNYLINERTKISDLLVVPNLQGGISEDRLLDGLLGATTIPGACSSKFPRDCWIENGDAFSVSWLPRQGKMPFVETGQLEPPLSKFTEEEEGQMKGMIQRLGVLAKHAVEYGVRLIVDTEQTYFQPAILRLTVEMKRSFNRDKAVVFNTYQCYFKGAFDNVSMGIKVSRREGWCFGAKLVRGAYMYQERSRAAEIGYEDPINPDYESTNRKYQRQEMF